MKPLVALVIGGLLAGCSTFDPAYYERGLERIEAGEATVTYVATEAELRERCGLLPNLPPFGIYSCAWTEQGDVYLMNDGGPWDGTIALEHEIAHLGGMRHPYFGFHFLCRIGIHFDYCIPYD